MPRMCRRIVALGCLICAVPVAAQEGIVAGVRDLTDQVHERTQGRRLRVAVADFTDLEGSSVRIGQFMAEEMMTQLMKRGEIRVVERRFLAQVVEELRLNLPDRGLVDPGTSQRLGRMLGVDALAVGSITLLQRTLRVHVRLISTETGELLAGASTFIPFADEIAGAMEKVSGPAVWTAGAPPASSPPFPPSPAPLATPLPRRARPQGNLLVNGDFSEAWTVGWKRVLGDIQKGENAVEMRYLDAGRVFHLRHVGESHVALVQAVPVEGVEGLRFEVAFQCRAWQGRLGGDGTAAIRLIYENAEGERMGETDLLRTTRNRFETESPLMGSRVHQIGVNEGWNEVRLVIADEIRDYLPGVDPARVGRVTVALFLSGAGDDQCGAELWTKGVRLGYDI